MLNFRLKFKPVIPVLMLAALLLTNGCGRTNSSLDQARPEEKEEHAPEQVSLSPEAMSLAGIKIMTLAPRSLRPELLVPAEVVLNPRAYYRLTARVSGRVEELLVYQGDRVRPGQVVARLFSLPYLESLTELRLAAERLDKLTRQQSPEQETARALLESAREKLKLLGLSDKEIEALPDLPSGNSLYEIRSPASGQVVSTSVYPGDTLEAGALLMEIAAFDRLWIEGRVQEKDQGLVSPGQEAIVRTGAYPGEEFKGTVTFISPVLDTATRTLKVRVEAANPGGRLKPGMYVDLALLLPEKTVLTVPQEAVVEISGRKTIFIPQGPGVFISREIQTGSPIKGWLPVISGLESGQEFVAAGAFMLKAELLKHTLGEGDHHHD
ncbi:MAG: efflux RND transporter periplasmic adaptor subunit [Candidatus Saccharicenans sp.]|uniref:efflux RND transporter periplasmic adaptor subunit n=1 Tax=Candidatus Saccharicenans sp. TaxID=2819258 RepID=UPI004049612E